jgi:hypothetical protein
MMIAGRWTRQSGRRPLVAVAPAAGITVAATASSQAAAQGPCDICAAVGTPYVAALSTTRGYPSAATQNAAQANIVAAGYGAAAGKVHAVGADQCPDDTGSTTTLGTQQEIWDRTGGANQVWTRTSPNQLTLTPVPGATVCLDVTGKSTANGAWSSSGPATAAATSSGPSAETRRRSVRS